MLRAQDDCKQEGVKRRRGAQLLTQDSCSESSNGLRKGDTKERRHSSQNMEKWTSKQCPRVVPQSGVDGSVPKDKQLRVRAEQLS